MQTFADAPGRGCPEHVVLPAVVGLFVLGEDACCDHRRRDATRRPHRLRQHDREPDHRTAGEIAKYGTPTIKRAYGDWTTPRLVAWKEQLLRHAIQPVQQFAYTSGKNATDSALIIDAMDLLYAGNLEGFVIVSSDSDFTRLATRLRESGMTVYGLGRRSTPAPFVAACDRFIYLDLLQPEREPEVSAAEET